MPNFTVTAESSPGIHPVTVTMDAPDRDSAIFAAGYHMGQEVAMASFEVTVGFGTGEIADEHDLTGDSDEFGSITVVENSDRSE